MTYSPTPSAASTPQPRSSVASQFLDLDFSHGIYADIHSTTGLRAAPDGAATLNTYGCVGGANGLFPGPRPTTSTSTASISEIYDGVTVTQPSHRPPSSGGRANNWGNGRVFLVDGMVMSPVNATGEGGHDSPTSLYSMRWKSNGTGVANGYDARLTLLRTIMPTASPTNYVDALTGSSGIASYVFGNHIVGPGSLTMFQMDPSAYAGATVRIPSIVGLGSKYELTAGANSIYSCFFAFPDGTNPADDTPLDGDATVRRYIFSHQGILVCITGNGVAGATYGSIASSRPGEGVVYGSYGNAETVPNNGLTYLAEENPSGYGSWASLNANELLLIKHRGGGVLVRGAIENPTVIRLPNIHSTHGYPNIGAATPTLGYVYFSALGAFAWNGQDTSTPIAPQLPPKFWVSTRGDWSGAKFGLAAEEVNYGVAGVIGRAAYCEPYLFAPNGYMLDTRTNAWWRAEQLDATIPALTHWDTSAVDARVWGFRDYLDDTHLQSSQCFDVDKGTSGYLYESQPLTPSRDRRIEVRELQVTLSGTSGSAVAITLTGLDNAAHSGTTQTETISLSTTGVSLHRIQTALTAAQVQVQIVATSNDTAVAAPRVLSFRVVYAPQTQL